MSNEFNYKGYSGSCIASIEDGCLHGRILFINDLIVYEGSTISELSDAFKLAVDNYVTYCAETGKPANKPFSGSFNVRISPELHKIAAQCARRSDITLNEYVRLAIEKQTSPVKDVRALPNEIILNHKITITHAEKSIGIPFDVTPKDLQWLPGRLKVA